MTTTEAGLDPIVSIDWLLANLAEVVLVDARAYLDERDGYTNYLSGHIPGSVYVEMDTVFAGPPAAIEGRHPLPDPATLAAGLGAVGIDESTSVVAYDDAGGMIAGRLVWMLRALGQSAGLLDGGIQSWLDHPDTEPLEVGTPLENGCHRDSRTCAVREFPSNRVASADEVVSHLKRDGVVADSRAFARYKGDVETVDSRAGHIPGAISLPFTGNLTESGRFLTVEELAQRFTKHRVDSDTIFYCGSGVSACNNLLAVEAAGLGRPRLYVGSWSGWSSDPSRPVATGPDSGGE